MWMIVVSSYLLAARTPPPMPFLARTKARIAA
jgi:hypothetical protein